jgi:protein phosphatase
MSSVPPSPPRTRLVVAGVTDVGRQRKHNEDCILVRPEHGLFCVADGMGGHNAGDVASKLVATSLGNFFEATGAGAPIGELPDEYAALTPDAKRLAAGVRKANHDVFTISNTVAQHHGMGSTCVAIHVARDMVHIAHVGDSRCYRIRDGAIQQMTRDHSLINDALDMKPDLTPEELKRLPKNIITRALGMKDAVKVDVKTEQALPGDVFLLCSDGLSGLVPPEQILEVVSLTPEPQEAAELLVAEANDAGGNDNISALIVRVEDAQSDTSIEHVDIDAAMLSVGEDEIAAHELDEHDEDPTPAAPEIAVAAAAALARKAPALELVEQPEHSDIEVEELPVLDQEQVEAAIAAFARGDELDVDLKGSWPGRVQVRRCARCSHELYMGNLFCVECGLRIESASA